MIDVAALQDAMARDNVIVAARERHDRYMCPIERHNLIDVEADPLDLPSDVRARCTPRDLVEEFDSMLYGANGYPLLWDWRSHMVSMRVQGLI